MDTGHSELQVGGCDKRTHPYHEEKKRKRAKVVECAVRNEGMRWNARAWVMKKLEGKEPENGVSMRRALHLCYTANEHNPRPGSNVAPYCPRASMPLSQHSTAWTEAIETLTMDAFGTLGIVDFN